jgi:UDP-N-acetylmuramate dehydrogenase
VDPDRLATEVAEDLRARVGGLVRQGEPMSRHTTFKIGGPADLFVVPAGLDELRLVLATVAGAGLPVTVVGRGSNLLIDDAGVRGVVIQMGPGIDSLTVEGEHIHAGAGVALGRLARAAERAGLSGMEWGVLVPGNLGGGIYMNAGANQQETKEVVRRVTVVDRVGGALDLTGDQCSFAYRKSRFQDEDLIVCEADLELVAADPLAIKARMDAMQARRKTTMPVGTSTAGATFKRPAGGFAGQLIESAGCKGWRVGGVQVSPLHANFFINEGGGTAADVRELIDRVRKRVEEFHGIRLEREVVFAGGEAGWDLPYAGRGRR